jgi:hypothetical protein
VVFEVTLEKYTEKQKENEKNSSKTTTTLSTGYSQLKRIKGHQGIRIWYL